MFHADEKDFPFFFFDRKKRGNGIYGKRNVKPKNSKGGKEEEANRRTKRKKLITLGRKEAKENGGE
jgi:hypothetical protein